MKKIVSLLVMFLSLSLFGCTLDINLNTTTMTTDDIAVTEETTETTESTSEEEQIIAEDGIFNTKDEVALYLHTYGKLPSNYVTKSVFNKDHWTPTNKLSAGGDYFQNREGLLPKATGRQYYEADIGYSGGSRNAYRIVYSNDGLIYYTHDHYGSFTLLYGSE